MLSPVLVSLVVISLMVITGVVTWNDILANKPGWNVLVWFATLVAMADGLNQVGFLPLVRGPQLDRPGRPAGHRGSRCS